jgi:phosphoribosyl-ATP pyrophosphohydrolase
MIIDKLYEVIVKRIEEGNSEKSYVAKLHSLGEERILKKVSEECFELIMAGKDNNKEAIIYETADLIFHILILLAEKGVKPEDIFEELERRFGVSGLNEKKQRKGEKK